MNALDVELEVLRKQMEAALKLSEDKSLAKNIRRKHRQTYHDTHRKVSIIKIFILLIYFFSRHHRWHSQWGMFENDLEVVH